MIADKVFPIHDCFYTRTERRMLRNKCEFCWHRGGCTRKITLPEKKPFKYKIVKGKLVTNHGL